MSDRHPDVSAGFGTVTGGATDIPPPRVWSIASALTLVVIAFVLALLAGAAASAVAESGWAMLVRTLTTGGILLGLYALLLGFVWLTTRRMGLRFTEQVGLARGAGARWYAAAFGVALVAWVFSAGFTAVLTATGLELPRDDLAVLRLIPGGALGTGITVLLLVVVAPLAEEVVYRGVLLPSLSSRWGGAVGLIASSVLFSAAHVSRVGFVPLAVAGGLFGWLFLRSGSLRAAVVAHGFYNALGVAALLVLKAKGLS